MYANLWCLKIIDYFTINFVFVFTHVVLYKTREHGRTFLQVVPYSSWAVLAKTLSKDGQLHLILLYLLYGDLIMQNNE